MMTEEDVHSGRKQSLCQKYGLSEQQLDFAYVNACEDPKTLEKILKVLRSNEEGYFPALEKAAEERLRTLCADSHLLLNGESVSLFSQLSKEDQEKLTQNFLIWGSTNNRPSGEELKIASGQKEYPAIRNSKKVLIEKSPVSKKPLKSCAPRSLDAWHKFDYEKELSLLDREDELKKNQFVRANNESKIHTNESIEHLHLGEMGAGDARLKYAIQEKTKGNDYYKEKDYQTALKYYNKSLEIAPLPDVYNNRAQVYLNMEKYDLALADCNKVLEVRQDEKAYYRKSTALMKLDRLQEAQESIEKALMLNPSDKSVQDRANRIHEKLNLHPSTKKVRILIQEDGETRKTNPLIEEICSRDIYYPFNSSVDNIELNDIGTARNMCHCNGIVPPFIAKLRSVEEPPHSNRLYLRKARSKMTPSEKSLANRLSKKASGMPNGEIIEKDTIEAGEKITCINESAAISTPQSHLGYCLNSKDLGGIAKELLTLHASQLSKELSDRLDSTTLNLCVKALCGYLQPLTQWKVIQEHLLALSHLPKFRSAVKSLDRSSKKALSATIAAAEEEGQRVADVLTLYELNGAMPPPS